jgi:hypothetical protein
LHPWE